MTDVFEDRAVLCAWLAANHEQGEGVWVVFYKGDERTLSYDIAEEALCCGWVDSKPGKVDEEKTKLYLAPLKRGAATFVCQVQGGGVFGGPDCSSRRVPCDVFVKARGHTVRR